MSLTLLLSSAGRRVALLECFRADAAAIGVPLRIVAMDMDPSLSAACSCADVAYRAPRCTSEEFVPFVQDLVAREDVALIVPTIDTELPIFAHAAPALQQAGALVNISSEAAVRIARSKELTAETLARGGIGVPRTSLLSVLLERRPKWRWPLIAKPLHGSSSVGIRRAHSYLDLENLASQSEHYVVQELLEGAEYTVNLYFDATGALRCAVPHRRIEVRAGEVSKGRTERLPALMDVAERMATVLPRCRGAMCFQAIVSAQGEIAVFEINARFGGGYPLAHAAGATFSRWLLQEAIGAETSASSVWREGVTMLRYDAAVFVETP